MAKHSFKEHILYGGVSKEEYQSIIPFINEENHRVWKVVSVILEILFVGLFIFALIDPGHEGYIVPFGILAGTMILFVLAFLILKSNSKALLPIIYVSWIIILACFIYIGAVVEKDRPAVVYCGVVMGITLITLDRPIRTGIIPLIGLSVYIPLILVFKTSSTLVVTDILDASIFTLAGIAISIFVGRIRIRDMVMRRTAEIERDKDALTNVANKLAFDRRVDEISIKMKDEDIKFALAIFDINGLKATNDTYGHGEGDKLLIRCADIIKNSFPNSEIYRIGGDEFSVILTDVDYANRERLIRELHERIDRSHDKASSLLDDTPIAFGVAVFNKGKDHDFASVFSRADAEMYDNKRITKAKNSFLKENK